MPAPGKAWWHIIWSTYGSWLPGDPRGFRNRHHRIHSSGDYKSPPPAGEHAGLQRYARAISKEPVFLEMESIRSRVCGSIVSIGDELQIQILAAAVARSHVHLLIELPTEKTAADELIRKLKTKSSAAISAVLAGRVWSRGGKRIMKRDPDSQRRCFHYICDHARKEGASVWTFGDRGK